MKHPLTRCLCALSAVSACSLMAAPIPTPQGGITPPQSVTSARHAQAKAADLASLYFIRTINDAAFSPDGSRVFFSTNLTGRMNLWSMPSTGGFPLQLTQSNEAQTDISPSPDGQWIAFQSDQGGNEVSDLFLVPVAGGEVSNLTNTPETVEMEPHFSPDGKQLAFLERHKDKPSFNVALLDRTTRQVRRLTAEAAPDQQWQIVGFGPKGTWLLANRWKIDHSQCSCWRIDVASGRATQLSPEGDRYDKAIALSPDGQHIALKTKTDQGHQQAALLQVTTGEVQVIAPERWEQSPGGFSPDSRHLLITTNVDGQERIQEYDLHTRKLAALPIPIGVHLDWRDRGPVYSPNGKSLLYPHQSGNTPLDYWLLDRASGQSRQLTRLGLAGLGPDNLPPAQVVTYPSQDGTLVSGLLWMPFNLERNGKAPAVVLPHGGPTWQTSDRFDPVALALASRGYVVMAPNPRGSTGYGLAFQTANRFDLGGMDLVDEVYATRFLVSTGFVDPKRLGITGVSYGGFMTLMALGKTPEVWAAGVEVCGIVNWYAMWDTSTTLLRYYQKSLMGEPSTHKAVYEACSPMTYLKHTQAPLLVLQGENDPRVPKGQAMEIVSTLQKLGKPVEAHYYPDEGHIFAKRENQIDALQRIIAWFDKHLKGPRP